MRGEGRVFFRGDVHWIAYYRAGEEFRESAVPAIREVAGRKRGPLARVEAVVIAHRLLRLRLGEVENERRGIGPFIASAQERITVNEWLDDLVTPYRLGGKKCKPRESDAPMRSHIKKLRAYFGDMRVMTVRQRHIQEYVSLLKSQGKKNSTVDRSCQLLGQAFAIGAIADPPKVLRFLRISKLDESGLLFRAGGVKSCSQEMGCRGCSFPNSFSLTHPAAQFWECSSL